MIHLVHAIFKYFKGYTKNPTNITTAIIVPSVDIIFNKNSNIQLMDITITCLYQFQYIDFSTIVKWGELGQFTVENSFWAVTLDVKCNSLL